MTSELDQSLPQERDAVGNKVKQPRNTATGMLTYFSAIERLCEEKSISPENVDQFFRVHWLRDSVGGSFKRAQEMFLKYIEYVETVPEEARQLAIPKGITTAVDDLMSLITWYYRMSYEDIQSDKVKELVSHIQALQTDIGNHETRHREHEEEIVHQKSINRQLFEKLEKCTLSLSDTTLKYEQSRDENLALEQQRNKIQSEADRLQLSCDNLTSQLSERRHDLASQQDYLKQLVSESRTQQGEISSLRSERNTLKSTVVELSNKLETAATAMATLKTEHARELDAALKSHARAESQLRELGEQCETATSELETLKGHYREARVQNETLSGQLNEKSEINKGLVEGMLTLKEELFTASSLLTAEKAISANLKETVAMLSGAATPRAVKPVKNVKAGSKKSDKP
ncbi:hypothetical protein I7V28_23185 [Lelliottia amnigena]|uniref:hypothetical protein n=1 Tax=Lelliottia TaxID=1330545 RepID=UPI00192C7B50|nr:MULTISPECIES: hypothetical protein [Lelliottia]MBL5885567.1 hypothetical protein [Lelliottia aquatilis]MBL5923974.1 hypothetical protein [Lelliottia amnigena]MBL5932833.1 hypothetical protein [Lelliottia amnigena]